MNIHGYISKNKRKAHDMYREEKRGFSEPQDDLTNQTVAVLLDDLKLVKINIFDCLPLCCYFNRLPHGLDNGWISCITETWFRKSFEKLGISYTSNLDYCRNSTGESILNGFSSNRMQDDTGNREHT